MFFISPLLGSLLIPLRIAVIDLVNSINLKCFESCIFFFSYGLRVYKIINISTTNRTINLDEISKSKLSYVNSSKLTAPTTSFPVYYKEADNIKVFPTTISSATIDYIKMPADPVWAYETDANGALTYSESTGSSVTPTTGKVDFTLHVSDRVSLILGILKYAGVVISDPQVVQAASAEANSQIQLENL